jgi:excisionase family DNA binding protein
MAACKKHSITGYSETQRVLTAEQALKLLNGAISRTTWYKALKSGAVPARRIGKRYLLRADALLEWIKGGPAEEVR